MSAPTPGPGPTGSAAEEAARLVDALHGWWSSHAEPAADVPAGDVPAGDGDAGGGHRHDDGPAACRVCPICRGIALVQSVRPEVVEHLAAAAESLAAALREVAGPQPPPGARSDPGPGPAPDVRIDVQDDDDPEGDHQ